MLKLASHLSRLKCKQSPRSMRRLHEAYITHPFFSKLYVPIGYCHQLRPTLQYAIAVALHPCEDASYPISQDKAYALIPMNNCDHARRLAGKRSQDVVAMVVLYQQSLRDGSTGCSVDLENGLTSEGERPCNLTPPPSGLGRWAWSIFSTVPFGWTLCWKRAESLVTEIMTQWLTHCC